MSRSRYTLLINWFIHWLIFKKCQSVSRTCTSGVSYYIVVLVRPQIVIIYRSYRQLTNPFLVTQTSLIPSKCVKKIKFGCTLRVKRALSTLLWKLTLFYEPLPYPWNKLHNHLKSLFLSAVLHQIPLKN